MKYGMKVLFSVALLLSTAARATTNGNSFFLGGNVGNVMGNTLIEQAGRTHRFDSDDKIYGSFNVSLDFNGSFNTSGIGTYFSPVGSSTFTVGALTNGVPDADVWNVFFLLDPTYAADITLKPTSFTITTDLNCFVGLDEFVEGLWFNVDLPLVWNQRKVKIVETETEAAATPNNLFPADYFQVAAGPTIPYSSFTEAMVGNLPSAATDGLAAQNMQYGQINGTQSKFAVGNVILDLGYDFINKENAHLGLAISGLVNGNGASKGTYLFEPSIGTGGRMGIGGTVNGHVRLWEKDDMTLNAYLNADIYHLFNATEVRSYDLTSYGTWSRYLLFKQFTAAAAGANVANSIVHAINFTTLSAKIGINVMYDLDLMLNWTNGSFDANIGYGLWGHSAEVWKSWVSQFTGNFYGAYSYRANMNTNPANNVTVSPDVTISGGTAAGAEVAAPVASSATNVALLSNIDTSSGLNPAVMTNRVYADLAYRWQDNEWEPHVGVGGGAEFSNNNNGMSQWVVHLHGGICF